jgi:hypothetical protein
VEEQGSRPCFAAGEEERIPRAAGAEEHIQRFAADTGTAAYRGSRDCLHSRLHWREEDLVDKHSPKEDLVDKHSPREEDLVDKHSPKEEPVDKHSSKEEPGCGIPAAEEPDTPWSKEEHRRHRLPEEQ